MQILITITAKNCLEYTKACVESIDTKIDNHILIVDDFSTDGTKEWAEDLIRRFDAGELAYLTRTKAIHVLTDPPVDSLAARWNMAMSMAENLGCEAALICNNDILFSPLTIDTVTHRLEKAVAEDEPVVMVTASNQRDAINAMGLQPEQIRMFVPPEPATEADHPDFSCFLYLVSAWHKVGMFDENYKPCYFEDNDTHSMLKLHGLRAISTTAAPYYHYGSRTQNSVKGGVCSPAQFDDNRRYFVSKFGCMPHQVDALLLRARKRVLGKESLNG